MKLARTIAIVIVARLGEKLGIVANLPADWMKVCDLRRGGVFVSERGEQIVERQDEVGIFDQTADLIEQFNPYPPAASLLPIAVPGVVDEDAAYRLGGGEEVTPAARSGSEPRSQLDEGGVRRTAWILLMRWMRLPTP
ncbi:MAG: hypothetical protein U0791_16565 [Gemmataceae bacterium]